MSAAEVLSFEQERAVRAATDWFKTDSNSKQVFKLFGHAGTGKTLLAQIIAERVGGEVCFAAFSGKAASVLRNKGCSGAGTLHSKMYIPFQEQDATGKVRTDFIRNLHGELARTSLIVVDECSMVGSRMARDLLGFCKPVLVLGDPFQLPPIGEDVGYFTRGEPNVMLTEVRRQAADNPLVALATAVRQGKLLKAGQYADSQVIRASQLDVRDLVRADQVLVGTTAMRMRLTSRLRSLDGFATESPEIGDKLVCTRNNSGRSLYNGTLWTVTALKRSDDENVFKLRVTSMDEMRGADPRTISVNIARSSLAENSKSLAADNTRAFRIDERGLDHLAYANALSVHKGQGSQWDRVFLFDERSAFPNYAPQWLYTGITRAAERITIVTQGQ